MNVNGEVAEGFEPVREAFVRNFETLGERGAAVSVYRHGRKVVDLWGGTRDVDGTADSAPWEHDTAHVMHSATKGVGAAVLLMLHERGELDLDAPVGKYWPEFKARGKEHLLVRHVLSHQAGVPVVDAPLTPAEAADPDRTAESIAAQTPLWEPGTDHGYHPHTFGWMLSELVRRVTGGRGVGEFIATEIAAPLGLDLWVGLPGPRPTGWAARAESMRPSRRAPCAPARSGRWPRPTTTRTRRPSAPSPRSPRPRRQRPRLSRRGPPASNGIATADGLARFYAALIGEPDGTG
ncbi:serine hydrolase [Streptomyces mirabilis]|nr:serine hydrolase [Streptomyces mirabilis]